MTGPEEENLNATVYEDEIDLMELFNVIWKGKILILSVTTVVALSSIFYSLNLTNYYTSESVLVAREAKEQGPLSDYSGMASLVGVSLAGSSDGALHKVIQIIESREFVKHLLTFENVLPSIMPSIMAAKSYDAASQELYFDPEIYNGETKTWTREPSKNKGIEPSYLEVHKAYHEMMSIDRDKITGHISMKLEHISPVFAKDFLALIINEANNLNREKEIDSSNKAINHLKKELSETSLFEIRESINTLIGVQLETRMMASVHDEYSLISLEPPFIPEMRSSPVRSLIVILTTLAGGILSVLMVLVRHYFLDKGTIDKQTTV